MKKREHAGSELAPLISIGVARSGHGSDESAPVEPGCAKGYAGTVEVFPQHAAELRDIERCSHIVLLYRLNSDESPLLIANLFMQDGEHGIFAMRHPRRSNGIGFSVVKLMGREKNTLFVESLDIPDGTPIIDIRPLLPGHDAREGRRAERRGNADLAEAIRFHGHLCPGLAIGFRASKAAMERLGAKRAEDEELIAIVENDSCSVDAVQWVTGCTFGKGNLFFRDYGKQVFTFATRPTGRAVRLAIKRRDHRRGEPPIEDREARTRWLLSAPLEDIFDIRTEEIPLPDEAKIRESVTCSKCGEEVMISRTVKRGRRILCVPCSKERE